MQGNPLDFTGPEFLLFYLFISIAVLAITYGIRYYIENIPDTSIIERNLSADPFAIAYLKNGKQQMIEVTVLSLYHRGLLVLDRKKLQTADGLNSVGIARRPIEKAILQHCITPCYISTLYTGNNITNICDSTADLLRGSGLIPNQDITIKRWLIFFVSTTLLLGISLSKIAIALQRGHTNIAFLIIMTIIAIILLYKTQVSPLNTAAGNKMLKRMAHLFYRLKYQVNIDHTSNDLIMQASIFGVSALPASIVASLPELGITLLPPSANRNVSNNGGSSCSSGGGGSSCGGGGSSCGGGGGCGGCG